MNIVTIHDIIPLLYPEFCDTNPIRLKRLLENVINQSDMIVTISETVKRDLQSFFGLPPTYIRVIPQITDTMGESAHIDPDTITPCPDGSFVHIGTIERRKNIARLIEAHSRSRSVRNLVLIGPDGFGAEEELSALARHAHPERVIRLPWIDRNSLLAAMSRARAIVFPSLAEGFGLPIIEAMALGVPVLTSKGGTTEEIAGNAGLLVDPYDIASISHGLAQLDNNDERCCELIERGRERIISSNMHDYGSLYEDLYKEVLTRRQRPFGHSRMSVSA